MRDQREAIDFLLENERASYACRPSRQVHKYASRLRRYLVDSPALAALFLPRLTLAAQVIPLTLEQMVSRSSDVIVATVLSAESRWGGASKRWMLTDYRVQVERVVRGDIIKGVQVKVTFSGGTMEGETQRIAGMQLPVVGERQVLMLQRGWAQMSGSPIVGLDQGLFTGTTARVEAKPSAIGAFVWCTELPPAR